MSAKDITVGWYYVVNQEAGEIIADLFKKGIGAGAVVTVSQEKFETVRDGVVCLPLHIRPVRSQVIVPMAH